MKKFNETKVGDVFIIDGIEYSVYEAKQSVRGFKVFGISKEGKKITRYEENPNATI